MYNLVLLVGIYATVQGAVAESSPEILTVTDVRNPISNLQLFLPLVMDNNGDGRDKRNVEERLNYLLSDIPSREFNLERPKQIVLYTDEVNGHVSKKDLSQLKHKIPQYGFNNQLDTLNPRDEPMALSEYNSLIQMCFQYVQDRPRVEANDATLELIGYLCEEIIDSLAARDMANMPILHNDDAQVSGHNVEDSGLGCDCSGCFTRLHFYYMFDNNVGTNGHANERGSAEQEHWLLPTPSAPSLGWFGPIGSRRQ